MAIRLKIPRVNIVTAGSPGTNPEVIINYGNYYKPTVSIDGTISWEYIEGKWNNDPEVLPINIKGPGILVLGVKASVEALPNTAAVGDCWGVGMAAPYSYYVWDGAEWINHGSFVLPYFTPSVSETGDISWSNNGGLVNPVTRNIAGPPGADGAIGPTGLAATINVGTITTLAPDSSATIQNVGTENAAIFNFGIPRGATGATGATGVTGATGANGPNLVGTSTSTDITGLIKGNGTNIALAIANTDYATPSAVNAKYDTPIRESNQSVLTSAWTSDSTYTAYPYRASVPITGALAIMTPDIVFALADAVLGTLAPIATTYDGGVYIYASAIPSATINIATITLWKAVS